MNLARNVDWIKVLATERAGTPDTDPRKQVYTEAELAAIVTEAGGARGFRCWRMPTAPRARWPP